MSITRRRRRRRRSAPGTAELAAAAWGRWTGGIAEGLPGKRGEKVRDGSGKSCGVQCVGDVGARAGLR